LRFLVAMTMLAQPLLAVILRSCRRSEAPTTVLEHPPRQPKEPHF